ncbi:unnamed protein product [Owenia fusiformis]|uniref:Uncharacterized protein n=1 Tax=Owenia fusiformis TaxID=6347 RepID=A0A8J1T6H1_OWEFU|nr:unnamed protein product [Owenia fusiformis]
MSHAIFRKRTRKLNQDFEGMPLDTMDTATGEDGDKCALKLDEINTKDSQPHEEEPEDENKDDGSLTFNLVPDVAIDSVDGKDEGLKINQYALKKTIAEGMLDIALLMSNACQLKSLLQAGPDHEFYYFQLVMLLMSIVLQVFTGFILLYIGKTDITEKSKEKSLERWNNISTMMIFAVTVINVFISAFGISSTTPK